MSIHFDVYLKPSTFNFFRSEGIKNTILYLLDRYVPDGFVVDKKRSISKDNDHPDIIVWAYQLKEEEEIQNTILQISKMKRVIKVKAHY